MMETLVSLGIALITFLIGYGSLRQQVKNNRQVSDERYQFVLKEIDALKENNEVQQEILVAIAEIKMDIGYIKKHIEKE